jgi:cobyric acid synthase
LTHRIGLLYVPGALPCFEDFGNLPTDLVRTDGLVDGKSASEVLDMLIIPGGSLVESQTINDKLSAEVRRMAKAGKFVLGICAGFQILSKATDIGRLSATPIVRHGLGLLDVEFKPLICVDEVQANVVGASYLTGKVGVQVRGFHCHTYGDITVHEKAHPILESRAQRLDYLPKPRTIVSGAANKAGNVVGIMTHALLDQNPVIIEGITQTLGIDEGELCEIRKKNAQLVSQIKNEIGISTNIHPQTNLMPKGKRALLITALESGSGKTFIVTGLAATLKKRGIKVGVSKIGGDIRDAVPTLYLIKEPIKQYSSVKVADCGWKNHVDAVQEAMGNYEFLIVEGAMDAFTGILFSQLPKPRSTAEIAASMNLPTVVIAGCDKEGIEGGLVGVLNYLSLLRSLGVKTVGVILNRMCMGYLTQEVKTVIQQAFANAGVELLGIMPCVDVEGRGAIPEVEIKYEEFGAKALQAAEENLNLDKILQVAAAPVQVNFDYEEFYAKFRHSLLTDCRSLKNVQTEAKS